MPVVPEDGRNPPSNGNVLGFCRYNCGYRGTPAALAQHERTVHEIGEGANPDGTFLCFYGCGFQGSFLDVYNHELRAHPIPVAKPETHQSTTSSESTNTVLSSQSATFAGRLRTSAAFKYLTIGVGILIGIPIVLGLVWYILIDLIIYILAFLGWLLVHVLNFILYPIWSWILNPIFIVFGFVGYIVTSLVTRVAIYLISNALVMAALFGLLRTLPYWELAHLSHWWHIRVPIMLSSFLAYQGWNFAWGLLLCSYAVSLCRRHRDTIERRVRSVAYNITFPCVAETRFRGLHSPPLSAVRPRPSGPSPPFSPLVRPFPRLLSPA